MGDGHESNIGTDNGVGNEAEMFGNRIANRDGTTGVLEWIMTTPNVDLNSRCNASASYANRFDSAT